MQWHCKHCQLAYASMLKIVSYFTPLNCIVCTVKMFIILTPCSARMKVTLIYICNDIRLPLGCLLACANYCGNWWGTMLLWCRFVQDNCVVWVVCGGLGGYGIICKHVFYRICYVIFVLVRIIINPGHNSSLLYIIIFSVAIRWSAANAGHKCAGFVAGKLTDTNISQAKTCAASFLAQKKFSCADMCPRDKRIR